MADGGQCVTMNGQKIILQWSAGTWDSMVLSEVSIHIICIQLY